MRRSRGFRVFAKLFVYSRRRRGACTHSKTGPYCCQNGTRNSTRVRFHWGRKNNTIQGGPCRYNCGQLRRNITRGCFKGSINTRGLGNRVRHGHRGGRGARGLRHVYRDQCGGSLILITITILPLACITSIILFLFKILFCGRIGGMAYDGTSSCFGRRGGRCILTS